MIFFGREEETDVLLQRLAARRLIAVLGVSGCGTSSLVRAGVIPLLRTGLAEGLDGAWEILTLVPGSAPLDALDRAIGDKLASRSHALRRWREACSVGSRPPITEIVRCSPATAPPKQQSARAHPRITTQMRRNCRCALGYSPRLPITVTADECLGNSLRNA